MVLLGDLQAAHPMKASWWLTQASGAGATAQCAIIAPLYYRVGSRHSRITLNGRTMRGITVDDRSRDGLKISLWRICPKSAALGTTSP